MPKELQKFSIPLGVPTTIRFFPTGAIGESEEPPISDTPDYIEPIKAYRRWMCVLNYADVRVQDQPRDSTGLDREQIMRGILRSRSFNLQSISIRNSLVCKWVPKNIQRARCACFAESSPFYSVTQIQTFQPVHQYHQCGIYAWNHDPCWQPSEWMHITELSTGWGLMIEGMVWLWGLVVEHESGYRAEYAYPAEFWLWRHLWGYPNFGSVHKELLRQLSAAWDVPIIEKSA